MLLKLEQDTAREETEISIKFAEMSQDVAKIISFVRSVDIQIKCVSDGREKLLNASDIYYAESVDKRTFIYSENKVYRTDLRLYQLLETLSPADSHEISKSCILNINVLDYVRPPKQPYGSYIKNGERLNITRKYLADIKGKLQEGM